MYFSIISENDEISLDFAFDFATCNVSEDIAFSEKFSIKLMLNVNTLYNFQA